MSKAPFEKDWPNKPYNYDDIQEWTSELNNYGVLTGHNDLIVIDADHKEIVDLVLKYLPTTFTVKTGGGGYHFYYYCPDIKKKIILTKNSKHYGEVLSYGCQAVGPGSIHPNENHYEVAEDCDVFNINLKQFQDIFDDFILTDINQNNSFNKSKDSLAEALQHFDYPPADADLIAKKCTVIKVFKETGCAESEELWMHSVQLVRHCKNGKELCHEWSSKDKRYNEQETNNKLNNLEKKDIGPTCCETFQNCCDYCNACPYKGKIKTPIIFGVKDVDTKTLIKDLTPEEKSRAQILIDLAPINPKGCWIINEHGIFTYNTKNEESVQASKKPIYIIDLLCEDFSRPFERTYLLRCYLTKKTIIEFRFPANILSDVKATMSLLDGKSVITNKKIVNKFLRDYISNIVDADIKPFKAVNSLGWQSDEAFLFEENGKGLSEDIKPIKYIIDRKMSSYLKGFKTKGSFKKWKKIIDFYNQNDTFMPHMFSLLASIGSPLICYTTARNCILSLEGVSGVCKTLSHKIALSAWGDPEIAGFISSADTYTSMIGRAAAIKNMPLRIDETSKMKFSDLIYRLVNGKGKARCKKDGSLSDTASIWQTVTLMTTNKPILDKDITELGMAERNRILELHVEMPTYKDKDLVVIDNILHNNYGHLGRKLIPYIIKNKSTLLKYLEEEYLKFCEFTGRDKRFWSCLGAATFTIAKLALGLKLIDFDYNKYYEWFIETIRSQEVVNAQNLRENRGFENLLEFQSALKDYLTGHILVLNKVKDEIKVPYNSVKARLVKGTKDEKRDILYVGTKVVKEFIKLNFSCGEVTAKKLLKIPKAKNQNFKGHHMRCYEFIFNLY